MPQIFPNWMMSPVFMYGVPGVIALIFLWLLVTRNWRGLKRYIGLLVVIGLVGFTGFNAWVKYLFKDFQFQFPPAAIVVQPVAEMTFEDRIEAIGTTQANESTALTSNVSETIETLMFEEGQFVTKGTIIATLHDAEEQAALTEAQKAFNRSAELVRTGALSAARRDADKARLDIAMAQVNDRKIIAPFDGYLGLRSLSAGDIVNPGTVITTLDDIDPIKLEFAVPEAYLAKLSTGLPIRAKSEAYPGERFEGTVLAVAPRVDPVTRTIMVKATIPNPDNKLRAGMLMGVEIVRNARHGLAISEEALVSQGANKVVMVTGTPDENKMADVSARPIVIGTRMPGYVEVVDGLKPGEKVIVEGVIKAHPGAKVIIAGEKTISDTTTTAAQNAVAGKQTELGTMGIGTTEATPQTQDAPTTHGTPKAE